MDSCPLTRHIMNAIWKTKQKYRQQISYYSISSRTHHLTHFMIPTSICAGWTIAEGTDWHCLLANKEENVSVSSVHDFEKLNFLYDACVLDKMTLNQTSLRYLPVSNKFKLLTSTINSVAVLYSRIIQIWNSTNNLHHLIFLKCELPIV